MSVWDRIRRAWSEQDAERLEPEPAATPARVPVVSDEETALRALARSGAPNQDLALDLFSKLSRVAGAACAIDASIAVMEAHPNWNMLRLAVGQELVRLGKEDLAGQALRPIVEAQEPPVDALFLLAEIAERADDVEEATSLYQRVLALDVNYPNVASRLHRLREMQSGKRAVVEGATLMSSGALMGERFRVIRELGRGGAGTVFLAEDLKLKRRVALKLYHRRGAEEQSRLIHEAQVAAQFEHAGVIRILDVDLELGAIVMECVHGGSLKSMIAREGNSLAQSRQTLLSVCKTLMHIHESGWVHRDIKPSNILIRRTGEPVITDFGIARREGDSQAAQGTIGEGSMGFMSPEQALPGKIHSSADVFSLGASAAQLFRSTAAELPEELAGLLRRAVSHDAGERAGLPELIAALTTEE